MNAFAGRTITGEDDRPNATPVAVISYRAWQGHFGLDPAVIGAAFTINQIPYTIVGIAAPGFFGDRLRADPPDFWMPPRHGTRTHRTEHNPESRWVSLALYHRARQTWSSRGQSGG